MITPAAILTRILDQTVVDLARQPLLIRLSLHKCIREEEGLGTRLQLVLTRQKQFSMAVVYWNGH